MKNLFDYTHTKILKGIPTGNLVVKSPVEFDIGTWSYKTYDNDKDIRTTLKNKWCSSVINIFIFDKDSQYQIVEDFFESNLYEKHGRNSFLIYCLVVPKTIHLETTALLTQKQKFISDTYSTQFIFDDSVIFLNDFVKNIILI